MPSNSDSLEKIFQKNFLLRKTDFLSLVTGLLSYSTEDAKIILHNLVRDGHIFEIKIKDLATGNLIKYFSFKPKENERCKTELAKIRLKQQFSMLKGVLKDLEASIFEIDKRVKQAFTENKLTKETGNVMYKHDNPKRFSKIMGNLSIERALLNEMRKKKGIMAKITQVERKKALIEKALVDLDTKMDNGDFAECLEFLNKIKEVSSGGLSLLGSG